MVGEFIYTICKNNKSDIEIDSIYYNTYGTNFINNTITENEFELKFASDVIDVKMLKEKINSIFNNSTECKSMELCANDIQQKQIVTYEQFKMLLLTQPIDSLINVAREIIPRAEKIETKLFTKRIDGIGLVNVYGFEVGCNFNKPNYRLLGTNEILVQQMIEQLRKNK